MTKQLLTLSKEGIAKAKVALVLKAWSQTELAVQASISRQPVWKFFTGKPVEKDTFVKICSALELNWANLSQPDPAPRKLVEVKYFEPEVRSSRGTYALNGMSSHPARYRYVNCWMEVRRGIPHCCIYGAEGWFPFPDNKCDEFLGEYSAEIIGEIDDSRKMEPDRFQAA